MSEKISQDFSKRNNNSWGKDDHELDSMDSIITLICF